MYSRKDSNLLNVLGSITHSLLQFSLFTNYDCSVPVLRCWGVEVLHVKLARIMIMARIVWSRFAYNKVSFTEDKYMFNILEQTVPGRNAHILIKLVACFRTCKFVWIYTKEVQMNTDKKRIKKHRIKHNTKKNYQN